LDRCPRDAPGDVGLPFGAVRPRVVAGANGDAADAHRSLGGHRGGLAEQAVAVDAFGAGYERDAGGGGDEETHGISPSGRGLPSTGSAALPKRRREVNRVPIELTGHGPSD